MIATELLSKIKVASPCQARWEDMAGDDRSRFCRQCGKHVFNLSAMSTEEAAELIRAKEGKLCGRYYRRRDGTMLTTNCPVGAERYASRIKRLIATAVGVVLTSFGVMAWNRTDAESKQKSEFELKCEAAFWKIRGWLGLSPRPVFMGVIAAPLPPQNNPPPGPQSSDSSNNSAPGENKTAVVETR
jgi:hypothetical protein